MALTDYSDLEQEIADAPEPKVLARGTEVKFRITAVFKGTNEETDATYYRILCDVPDDPLVKDIQFFMNDLGDRELMTEKHFAQALNKFQHFAACIELDYSKPFDWEDDLPGMDGWAILGMRKSDEFGDSNTISKFVAPK